MHTPIRHSLKSSSALQTAILASLILFFYGQVAWAQNPPTGPAGGVLSGTYPNPTLFEDRVRRTGDIMSGGLSINIANSGGLVYPFTLGSSGAAAANRGISFQFNLPLSGLSSLGGELIAAREGAAANSFMSFSTHNGTAVSEALRITSAGNVGIGTNTPGARLVTFGNLLAGNINTNTQLYSGFDAQQNQVFELGYGTATGNITPLPVLILSKNLTNANQGLGSIAFANSNIANGNEKRLSAIGTYTDGALNSGVLAISTSTAGTLTERIRFTSNGRVGIGTTTPAHGLDVVGPGVWLARFKRTEASNGGIMIETLAGFNPNLALTVNGVNKWYMLSNSSNSDNLQFYESTGAFPRMTLKQDGTVGIGTPAPNSNYRLDVQGGRINASGGLCIADDCKTSWSAVGGSQWSNGSGSINYGGGMVGIGITTPLYTLDVNAGPNGFRSRINTASGSDAIATFENNSAIQMIVRGNGNVGIGATALNPTEKLHVGGNVRITGDIEVEGNIKAKYQDLAEWVESSQQLAVGTVVVVDPDKANQVIASTQSYDSRVAGVISLKPGVALGEAGEGRVLVATTGRVRVKVDATHGPIKMGDLLVTSDKEGVAMKSVPVELGGVRFHRPGTLLGKALEPLAQGTGEILVLLSLQ